MSIRSVICRLAALTGSAPAADERGLAASLWRAAQVLPPGAGDYLNAHRGAAAALLAAALLGALVAWYKGR